jgi:hypothetical protein
MIIHIENGRLGNLLFQYVGLKKYFPKKKLIFIGCNNFQDFFDNIDANFFFIKISNQIFFRLFKLTIFALIKIRFLGVIVENPNYKNYKIIIKKGLLPSIIVSNDIFFQHKNIISKINNLPVLKSIILKKGLKWFYKKKINLKKKIVFIHIRRGDYLQYPSKEYPAVLDINWYKQAIKLIKKKLRNPIFILMSDDKYYLKKIFKESSSVFISYNKPEIDLSIMSFCNAGILSPSSFSWWGAFYAKIRNQNNNYFIAPKYWIGHRIYTWIPENFYTKWITYI